MWDADRIRGISEKWFTHGYYGSASHNVKAIYRRYMGWFDGNPAHLWVHPPVESAERHVAAMGGADSALRQAQKAYDASDYRWAAQVLNYAVFADPGNRKTRLLRAATFEQLGYGSENATWRNFSLSGAYELRNGSFGTPTQSDPSSMHAGLSIDQIFGAASPRTNGPRAWGVRVTTDWRIPDDHGRVHRVELRNGVLIHHDRRRDDGLPVPDATVTTTRAALLGTLRIRTSRSSRPGPRAGAVPRHGAPGTRPGRPPRL
ncbi:hypothetical protein GCM10027089_59630 [Nocardia thraciensis]